MCMLVCEGVYSYCIHIAFQKGMDPFSEPLLQMSSTGMTWYLTEEQIKNTWGKFLANNLIIYE